MKLKEVVKIIQGHQITDEEIYRSQGEIPIFTGKNEIKGYWDKKIIEEKELPCITYPTKANTGEAYVQTAIFDANNTAVLIPLDEWRKKLDLEWLSFKLRAYFLQNQTSKEGVSYLNKEIVEDIDIEIPDYEEQKKIAKKFKELKVYEEKLKAILSEVQNILSRELA